jgi:hypothetical protein
MIQTTLVGKQVLLGYPSVLGESDPGVVDQPPEVRFVEVDDGVKFAPTSCGRPSMRSVSIQAVTQPLGSGYVGVKGEAVTLTRDVPYFGESGSVRLGNGVTAGRYAISLHISEDAAKQIQEREHEHIDDFTVAFELSFQALTNAINGLASQAFLGGTRQEAQDSALAALAERVPYLSPSEPGNPSAWTSQVKRVYAALAGLSTLRDGQDPNGGPQAQEYPHKPTWYAYAETPAENDKAGKLLISPRMDQAGTPSAVLITVEAAQADKSLGAWTRSASSQRHQESGAERPVQFEIGARVRITRDCVIGGVTIPAESKGSYLGKRDDTDHPFGFDLDLPDDYESKDFPNGNVTDFFPEDILDYVEAMPSGPVEGEADSPVPDHVSRREEYSPGPEPTAKDKSGSVKLYTDEDDDVFKKLLEDINSAAEGK